ncbi:MAG: helix-turn-helix domain-containing protein [Flavobacteriaceae bacterium]
MTEIKLEKGFFVLLSKNETDEIQHFVKDIDSNYIQFHFCIKGSSRFIFNDSSYTFDVLDSRHMLLYNTIKKLPVNLELRSKSWVISVLISIEKFHSLFSQEAAYIPFLSDENKTKKYYDDGQTTPQMAIVLNQILNFNVNSSIKNLYVKGKVYELLSLFFNTNEETNNEKCPFLIDEDYVQKIKKAKDIVISRMAEPPSLQELADEVGLSLKKIKEGFKQIYGDSVFSFLFNYKMEYARKLLETNTVNVNEVGLQVGYSTSSHFIAAFKKKFGITPKKYIQSLNQEQ